MSIRQPEGHRRLQRGPRAYEAGAEGRQEAEEVGALRQRTESRAVGSGRASVHVNLACIMGQLVNRWAERPRPRRPTRDCPGRDHQHEREPAALSAQAVAENGETGSGGAVLVDPQSGGAGRETRVVECAGDREGEPSVFIRSLVIGSLGGGRNGVGTPCPPMARFSLPTQRASDGDGFARGLSGSAVGRAWAPEGEPARGRWWPPSWQGVRARLRRASRVRG